MGELPGDVARVGSRGGDESACGNLYRKGYGKARAAANVDAYQALLRARYFSHKRTPEGLKKALEYCQQAIELDPRYAPAYTELAFGYLMGIWYIPLASEEAVAKARAAAAKALEIDDTFPEAHMAMTTILSYELDWSGAKKEWERVFELDPSCSNYGYAYTLLYYNPDEAVRWIKRAEELDPLSLLMGNNVGEILYYARRYDEAIIQLKNVLELDPSYAIAYWRLGDAYTQKGMYDEAIETFRKAIALSYRNPEVVARLGHAQAVAGRRSEAEKALDELLKISKRDHVSPYIIAWVFAGLGDKDKTIEMLEKAYQQRDSHIIGLSNDPLLDPLRSDPRYKDLLRRVGLPG